MFGREVSSRISPLARRFFCGGVLGCGRNSSSQTRMGVFLAKFRSILAATFIASKQQWYLFT